MYRGFGDTLWPQWCYFPLISYLACRPSGSISFEGEEVFFFFFFSACFMFKHRTKDAGEETHYECYLPPLSVLSPSLLFFAKLS